MMDFKIRNFRQQRCGTFAKDFIELFRDLLPCPHQILHRELKGKERILQLVSQAAGQFAPCGYALGLHQRSF